MKFIIVCLVRFCLWCLTRMFPLRVIAKEEYVYDREHSLLEAWGAHAVVSCESRLLGNLVRQEWMVQVNYPHRLISDGVVKEEGVEAIAAFFQKQADKVLSVTVLGSQEEMHYFLLAAMA